MATTPIPRKQKKTDSLSNGDVDSRDFDSEIQKATK